MRALLHWDGDSFFASVEQAADRRLRGRAVAVGGASRGLVLSVSARARRFGLRPGMTTTRARRLCPELIVQPAHFDRYEQFARQITQLCEEKTPLVEARGAGAAWADVTGSEALCGQSVSNMAAALQKTAAEWLRVPVSVGTGTNRSVARIAARLRKPGARVNVAAGNEAAFLAPLPLRLLSTLDSTALSAFSVAGIHTIGALAQAPLDALELVLGREARPVQRLALGIDETPVADRARKPAWQEEHAFAEDTAEEALPLRELRRMLSALLTRLRMAQLETRAITLTLRYTDHEEAHRSWRAAEPSALDTDFLPVLPALLREAWSRRVRLRGLRLQCTQCYPANRQMDLFAASATQQKDREIRLAAAVDGLRQVFGDRIVRRGLHV
jgi:nucleotidyltransferase/DNA polymerase involved in DNA repair